MKCRSKYLLEEIDKYESYTFKSDVEERLMKTLSLYIHELDATCNRILLKSKKNIVMKELSK